MTREMLRKGFEFYSFWPQFGQNDALVGTAAPQLEHWTGFGFRFVPHWEQKLLETSFAHPHSEHFVTVHVDVVHLPSAP